MKLKAAPSDGPAPRGWLVVALLWLAACSLYATRNLFVTMHGSIEAAVPMTESQFGLLTSVFLWVYAALNPLGGLLADRLSRSGIIIASLLAWSAVTTVTIFATTFAELLVLRAVMGMAQACYMPSASALVTDYHRGATRSLAVGLLMCGLVSGATLGGFSGWLAERHPWTFVFSLFGLPSLFLGVLLVFLLRDRPPRPEAVEGQPVRVLPVLGLLLGDRSVIALILCSVLQNFVSWILIGWMPTYLHEHFNLGQGAAGISGTAYIYVTQFFSLLLSGVWADRWSRRHVRARLWVPAIGLVLSAPGFFIAGLSVGMNATFACLCLWGVAVGFMGSNVMPALCLVTDPRHRATAYGLVNSAGAVAGGVAIYGTGLMRDWHIDLSRSLLVSGFCALACAALFLLVRTSPAPIPEPAA